MNIDRDNTARDHTPGRVYNKGVHLALQLTIGYLCEEILINRSINTYADKDSDKDKDSDVDIQVPMDIRAKIQDAYMEHDEKTGNTTHGDDICSLAPVIQ